MSTMLPKMEMKQTLAYGSAEKCYIWTSLSFWLYRI